jgi:uncharacterized protein involved in exopolysaccharide biosynthesis/Mrp family chromosome partitioning ATPase
VSRPPLTISVAQLARLIRARAGVVIGVALLVLGGALAIGYGARLVFVARTQLFLGEGLDSGDDAADSTPVEDGVSGELEILGSATLIERAISAAGLNTSVARSNVALDANPPRYSEWLAAGRDFAGMPRAENELAVAGASPLEGAPRELYQVEFLDAERYRLARQGEVLGEGRLGELLVLPALSWTLVPGPIRRPTPGARYDVWVSTAGSVLLDVSERLRISAPRPRGSQSYGRIVMLEFTASSPYSAERFLSALLDAYLQHRHDRKVAKLVAREAYLEGESRSVREALLGVEAQLARERSSQRTLWPGDEESPLLVERDRYRSAEALSLLELARLEVYSEGFGGQAPPLASFMDGESDDRQLAELSESLAEAERALTEARLSFGPAAPELREALLRVKDRTRAIDSYVEARIGRARERRGALGRLVRQSDRKLETVERVKSELAELSRDQEAYAETYTRLLEQKGEAAIVIARAVSKDRIVDPPRAVAEPASPNFRQALSSVLFGSFVGVLWVFFRRLTASRVQEESDARFFLGTVPVLGTVPYFFGRQRRPAMFADVLEQARVSGHSAFEDAFRLYGMTLFGADASAHQNLVFVTSPGPLDGKTTCALALGLALARRGRRVLIVDGSPVRSFDPERGSAPPSPGLSDVLAGRATLRSARIGIPAGSGELHVLSAGRLAVGELPAPADRLREFVDLSRARYDVVLVDVPGHVPTDMMALVGSSDAVLVVLRLRHTRRHALHELLANLPLARSVALVVDDRLGRVSTRGRSRPTPVGKEAAIV